MGYFLDERRILKDIVTFHVTFFRKTIRFSQIGTVIDITR